MTPGDSIVATMKCFRGAPVAMALAMAALVAAGCGGVQGSKSVSPSSFFVPGLIQNTRPATVEPGAVVPTVVSAPDGLLPS